MFKDMEQWVEIRRRVLTGESGGSWGSGKKMAHHKIDLDPGIRDAVILLWKGGFKTFTSCEGGKGHHFCHETIGLELDSDYRSFQKKLVKFLRSQGMEQFTISLVTDYPAEKSVVYLEGLDLLSADKRSKVIQAAKRKERKLRRQMRELGIS